MPQAPPAQRSRIGIAPQVRTFVHRGSWPAVGCPVPDALSVIISQERSCDVGAGHQKLIQCSMSWNLSRKRAGVQAPVAEAARFSLPWRRLKARGGFPPLVRGQMTVADTAGRGAPLVSGRSIADCASGA